MGHLILVPHATALVSFCIVYVVVRSTVLSCALNISLPINHFGLATHRCIVTAGGFESVSALPFHLSV